MAPAARFTAKFIWIIAKVVISLIALFVLGILLSILIEPLAEAISPEEHRSDISLGLFAAAFFALMFLLFRWIGIWKTDWAKPKHTYRPGVGLYSAAAPVMRSPVQSPWIYAKTIVALVAWAMSVGLLWFAFDWLCQSTGLEGVAADAVSGLLGALWWAAAVMLGLGLRCWVVGETWREITSGPPAYRRPDLAPEAEKN
jgi:hypothetical protein